MPPKKLQRWIDLLAALLVRRFPATFRELARDVPAYSTGTSEAALLRMFERDKDELRGFGIAIRTTTVQTDDGETGAYALDAKNFYLPYLVLTAPGGKRPQNSTRSAYNGLATLAFEPDELEAIAEAAKRVEGLGDPLLAADSISAQRKLAVDLPIAEKMDVPQHVRVVPAGRIDPAIFEEVNDALARRKTLDFEYHAMSTDRVEQRTVEPYGVFFLGAHWYLTGRDIARGELRNFRLSRMSSPRVNTARPQTADYEIPADFRLRDHAQSRHAWEVGDGDALDAVVEFRGHDGATAAAARLGAPIPGSQNRRSFQPRRVDVFARWLLSFGGSAIPIEPPVLVDAYRDQIARTREVYGAVNASAATSQEGAP